MQFKKEIKINDDAISITIGSWYTPVFDKKMDYKSIVKRFEKALKNIVYNNANRFNYCNKKYIVDVDMKVSGIEYNKKSYFGCDIILYKQNDREIYYDNFLFEFGNFLDSNIFFTFVMTKK